MLCGEPFPVSTQIERIQVVYYSKVTVPLGLFLVAFPPPPVTFPATRLSDPKIVERRCTLWVDHLPLGIIRFYPDDLRPGLPTGRRQAFRLLRGRRP